MGATLADGGVHPLTGDQVVDRGVCRAVLAVMTTAGLYETSGDWLVEVGLPGKSGIGGGMVTVSPGKGALGTFSPPLDEAGNSVRGQLTAAFLVPHPRPRPLRLRPVPLSRGRGWPRAGENCETSPRCPGEVCPACRDPDRPAAGACPRPGLIWPEGRGLLGQPSRWSP